MKAEDILIKAIKRSHNERGLRISAPNVMLSDGHIKKADHNLVVMTDLSKLNHEDWTIITAYYAMYHSALALLSKIGLESKDHATSAAVLEYFFGEQVKKELIEIFNKLKERKEKMEAITIEDKVIEYLWKAKRVRETVQYGLSVSYKETNIVMDHARVFVSKMKMVHNELDEWFVETIIRKKIEDLQKSAIK